MAQSKLENEIAAEPPAARQELAFDLPLDMPPELPVSMGFGDAAVNSPSMVRKSGAEPELTPDQLQLSRQSVEALVTLFTCSGSYADRGPVYGAAIFIASISIMALIGFLATGEYAWAGACMLVLLVEGGVLWQSDRLDQENTALAHAYLTDQHVGALYDALDWPDSRIRNIAGMLVAQAISRLRECDAEMLTLKRKFSLYRCLALPRARRNPALAIAILRGLPVFGTESALPYVERLASSRAFTKSVRQIRHAAREVLPLLEQRVAVERSAEEARIAAESPPVTAQAISAEGTEQQGTETPVIVDEQMRAFEEELSKIKQPGMRVGFLLAAWCGIVPYTLMQTIYQFGHHDWPLGLLFGGLTVVVTQLHRITLSDQHRALASRLAKMDDVKVIGRLCELLDWPDESMRSVAIMGLTPLLRRVKASDHVLHTPAQRASLYRNLTLLNAWRRYDFVISILKALEQIGDAAAVPYVFDLANAVPANHRERQICEAANACLPYVQNRAKLSQSSQMLLRASSAADLGVDSLVRAAGPSAESDPEQLLRAHGGNKIGDIQ